MSNEPKHTATPWMDDKFTPIPAGDDTLGLGIFRARPKVAVRVLSEENYQHAAKCVNEYDGLIETIESLRAENAELIEALRLAKDYLKHRGIIESITKTLSKYEKP